jgi:hypothetical protein
MALQPLPEYNPDLTAARVVSARHQAFPHLRYVASPEACMVPPCLCAKFCVCVWMAM